MAAWDLDVPPRQSRDVGPRLSEAGRSRLEACRNCVAPCPARHGRGDRIRTCDPHTPSVMRYQAALHPDQGCALYADAARDATRSSLEISCTPCTRVIAAPLEIGGGHFTCAP